MNFDFALFIRILVARFDCFHYGLVLRLFKNTASKHTKIYPDLLLPEAQLLFGMSPLAMVEIGVGFER